jgi:kynureninase
MTALEEALKVWDGVDLAEIRRASIALSTLFIAEVTRRCPQLVLASPADPAHRGSQVSFAFEQGYAFMQALIDHGVIGDFRAPNLMRFGITPLYLDRHDILQAVETIETIWANKLWQQQRYQTAQKVT